MPVRVERCCSREELTHINIKESVIEASAGDATGDGDRDSH